MSAFPDLLTRRYQEVEDLPSRGSVIKVLDLATDQAWIVKQVDEQAGINEMEMNKILNSVGVWCPTTWFDGNSALWMAFVESEGTFGSMWANGTLLSRLAWQDRLKIGVVDDIVGNLDRNGSNILLTKGSGQRAVPIDNTDIDASRRGGFGKVVLDAVVHLGGDQSKNTIASVLKTLRHHNWAGSPWADNVSEISSRIAMAQLTGNRYP